MPFLIDDILIGVPFIVASAIAAKRAVDDAANASPADAAAEPDVAATAPAPSGTASSDETILAVRGLDKVTPAVRQALLDAASTLGIPVDSLALVISSESGWNQAALNPLPAAGFIQLTTGARLPGFLTADAIRAITSMDPVDQIHNIVVPFYTRYGAKAQGATAGQLYMLNFLPGVAGQPATKVLGVRSDATAPTGETASSPLMSSSSLSLGTIYGQNPGFDPTHKGYFTIGDIYEHVQKLEDAVGGRRIDVAGNITQGGSGNKTAGGCGNWDFPEVRGNWAPWDDHYDRIGGSEHASTSPRDVSPARTAGGPARPPGYARAYEVFSEPDVKIARTAGGHGGGGHGGGHAFAHFHPQHGPRQGFRDFGGAYWDAGVYPYAWDPSDVGAVILFADGDPHGARIGTALDTATLQQLVDGYLASRGVTTAGGPAGGGHEGWGEVRMANGRVAGGPVKATPEQIGIIRRGIAAAVAEGSHDPINWTQMGVGEYQLMVSNEPITVNGLRLPTSKDDSVAVSKTLHALPITPVISDARWNDPRVKRMPAQPLNDPRGALYNDPDQVVAYNTRMGPNTGVFTDGAWKEVVVNPTLTDKGPHSMAQYGFKNRDGSMFEHGGPSNHDKEYKDYSDTPTYVSRQATKNGVIVDLLDEYAAGGPLTAALQPWQVEELRGDTGTVGA